MVAFESTAHSWPPTLAHRVCVVEPDQSGTIWRVQRQRVTQPVRALWSNLDSHDDEFHPVFCLVHEKRLTVKVELGIEAGITAKRRYWRRLSDPDNRGREEVQRCS